MNLEKEFVPHEPSLALKELGFDEPCFAFYNGKFGTIKQGKNITQCQKIDQAGIGNIKATKKQNLLV